MNQKITLKIQGMDCASCAAVIEHSLKKTKGVVSASVNFATEKAYLEFDSEKTNTDGLKKIVKDLGYKALDEDEDNASTDVKPDAHSHHHKPEKDLPAGRQVHCSMRNLVRKLGKALSVYFLKTANLNPTKLNIKATAEPATAPTLAQTSRLSPPNGLT